MSFKNENDVITYLINNLKKNKLKKKKIFLKRQKLPFMISTIEIILVFFFFKNISLRRI